MPRIKLLGTITEATTSNGRDARMAELDGLPDTPIPLLPTSLKFEGRRTARTASVRTPVASRVRVEPDIEAEDIDMSEM